MKSDSPHSLRMFAAVLVIYYLMLFTFLLASFFPQYRIWGVNWWAYFPDYVPVVLFAVGALVPIVMWMTARRREEVVGEGQPWSEGGGSYFIIAFGLVVLFGLAFYFLRARTHFLGDGYTLLSLLGAEKPLVKTREPGEALAHIWVRSLIGGDAETAALLCFQIIAISAGVLFLISLVVFARVLFRSTKDRILFLLGLASSGCMLLFFGYVENYSLFVLSVAAYSMMGLLVVKGKLNRWAVLPVMGLAMFLHVLGVTLIPSAIYLLLSNSKLGRSLSRLSRRAKLLFVLITATTALSLFYYYYSTVYFFRFALIPLFVNRFTVEGYTLFSLKHIVDYLNLVILLVPGLPLVAMTVLFLPVRRLFKQREYRFLLVLLASTLGATFIFDPKLGMPRDWDLFSFCGVPLALSCYYLVLDKRNYIALSSTVLVLAITLGFLSLAPRAFSQVTADTSLAHFRNYIRLDKERNRNSRILLVNHYNATGDTAMAQVEFRRWKSDHPEEELLRRCNELYYQERQLDQTVYLLKKALELNSAYSDAYSFLGYCYLDLKKYDSALALIKIADGLNPYNASTLNNLGLAYAYNGDYQRAERAFLKSVALDTATFEPLYNLVFLYRSLNKMDKYHRYLRQFASKKVAPAAVVRELGDYYLKQGEYEKAAATYVRALRKGLDSAYVTQLMDRYPSLRELFLRWGWSYDPLDSAR